MKLFTSLFTLIAGLLLTTTSVFAQVTITVDDFPFQNGVTTTFDQSTFSFSYPEAGSEQVFDYSSLEISGTASIDRGLPGADSPFPMATSLSLDTTDFQGFPIYSVEYQQFSDTAYSVLGSVAEDVIYPIANITGGPNDSIRFPAVILDFDGTQDDRIRFPLNYQDSWEKNFVGTTPFELTVAGFGLNQTPGARTNTSVFIREVIASGNVILPGEDGEALGLIPALVVRSTSETTSNYTLGGAPAPPALLTAFGLTQDAVTSDTAYVYYSPGLGAQLMIVYGSTQRVIINTEAASVVSAVKDIQLVEGQFYPNPVTAGRQLFIRTNDPVDAQLLQLVNMSGQVVNSRSLDAQSTDSFDINVPHNLPAGMYFVRVIGQSGKLLAVAKIDITGH